MRVFIDSNIPMYVAGAPHPNKEPSIRFMTDVATGRVAAVSDVEVLQEILHRYHHLRRLQEGFVVFDSFLRATPLFYPILLEDLLSSLGILASHPALSPRDAIHVAVMRRNGIGTIVSYDRPLDGVEGIDRIEP